MFSVLYHANKKDQKTAGIGGRARRGLETDFDVAVPLTDIYIHRIYEKVHEAYMYSTRRFTVASAASIYGPTHMKEFNLARRI